MISNEVRQKALQFTKNFEDAHYEKGEAQTFWGQFFEIFGVSPRLYKSFFENHTSAGFIDALWPGVVAVEHKSAGRDLDKAYIQARDYLYSLTPDQHPRAIVVCDFQIFRIYSMEETAGYSEFKLKDLPRKLDQFQFLLGGKVRLAAEEDPVNLKAAELMGQLHDHLADRKYTGEQLEVLLVRIMFMFFADDTGIFGENDYLTGYLERNTRDDGTDLGSTLNFLFDLVNIPEQDRPDDYRNNPEINGFRYINGGLFEDQHRPAPFDEPGRHTLLECARFNWAAVSPAIFGSLFQNVMTAETRRNLGAHYTSEENILKVINPLFMDDFREQFEKAYSNRAELRRLLERIKNTGIFDPACGCGNFLVISYRELRSLEIDIWKRLRELEGDQERRLDVSLEFDGINVDNMYGIEIEEFPSQIARAALWLQDHVMNMKVSEEFGNYYVRLPLIQSPNILHDNALKVDWAAFAPRERIHAIASNPPFLGHHYQSDEQKKDHTQVLSEIRGAGVLDYVSNWFVKSAEYITNTTIVVGLVATNSISQGEQVGMLWDLLYKKYSVSIDFAYRTFPWFSDAKGAAHVHVVIVGFAVRGRRIKRLFDESGRLKSVAQINPYLVDGPEIIVETRSDPICNWAPRMRWGNKPTDGGNLLITEEDARTALSSEPQLERYIRPYMGGRDFLSGQQRYCLWLVDASTQELRNSRFLSSRLKRVRDFRLNSKAISTREFADTPHLFRQISQPDTDYIAVPEVSSQRRKYIPMAFVSNEVICSNTIQFIPTDRNYVFGVMQSQMHMVWVAQVAGRLKSDFRYSNSLVYNNFPWPENPTERQKDRVEEAAQKVLDVRQVYIEQGQTLADLYDPLSMPADLLQAHRKLDTAVDRCYRKQPFTDERNRLKYVFALYKHYVTGDELDIDA
ncbi:MAG: DNA methyltransferase [Alkalispirochaeta sp.]